MHEASATKLKLMASSGNGGSAAGAVTTTSAPLLLACQQKEQQNQVAADQAREIILRAAVSAEATPPRVVESAKVGAVLLRSSKSGTAAAVRYRECQKNHAAGIGGHALDGCGEFMPGGEEGSMDALRCAACDCHRNFHRREVEGEAPPCECRRLTPGAGKLLKPSPIGGLITPGAAGGGGGHHQQQQHHHQQLPPGSAAGGQLATMQQTTPGTALALTPVNMQGVMVQRPIAPSSTVTMQQPMSAGPADSDDGDDGGMSGGAGGVIGGGGVPGMMSRSPSSIKKRFRTKFSGEQKEKMCDFADKLGWRIQKHDEPAVQEFCSTVGVKRHVLKVWMHNNKHTLGKKATSL